MSRIKQLIESTDPSFLPDTKSILSVSDIMISAEWDMIYERLRDEDKAELLGVNQEGSTARTGTPASDQIARTGFDPNCEDCCDPVTPCRLHGAGEDA